MKQQLLQRWIKLSAKLDAMTLRERVMVFAAATASVLFVMYSLQFEPMMARQKLLLMQIRQQQNQVAGIDAEIGAKVQTFAIDPDAAARGELQAVRGDIEHDSAGLLALQKGLVAPNRIAPLLEQLLRGHGKLRLMSMKTLPVTGLTQSAAPAGEGAKPGAPPAAPAIAPALATAAAAVGASVPASPGAAPAAGKPRELLYRHGVEIELQGSYQDMVDYMAALESMPVQVFWGKARLDAQQYPYSRLTLTLYTLSLDQNWMKL